MKKVKSSFTVQDAIVILGFIIACISLYFSIKPFAKEDLNFKPSVEIAITPFWFKSSEGRLKSLFENQDSVRHIKTKHQFD